MGILDPGQAGVQTLKLNAEITVTHAHEMEHRGVEIPHMGDIFNRMVAELIGRTIGCAPLHASAAEPHAETLDVVVTPGMFAFALEHGSTAELAPPDNQGILEQSTLLEISDQGPGGLVGEAATGFHVGNQIPVMIPSPMVEVDETHATFSQTTGQQAVGGKAAVRPFRSIHFHDVGWFVGEVH